MKKNNFIRPTLTALSLLFWLGLWHITAVNIDLDFILPTPWIVFCRLGEMALTYDFYRILFFSFVRIMTGFFGGMILGFLLGTFSHFFFPVRALFQPLIGILKATPVASFILVVILWLKREEVPCFIALIMVLPIVWQNTLLGFASRDKQISEMGKVFGFGKMKTFWHIDLPQVLPSLFAAARTGLGLAWKAGVAAEVLALPKISVGEMIHNAKSYLETPDLYAWTIAIIIFSVGIEKLMLFAFLKRRRYADS